MNTSSKKRILILTADAGFGHRSAANAVAKALEAKYANKCEFEIVNPLEDRRTPFFLRDSQSDYDKIVQNMPELYRFGYEASDAPIPTVIVESALIVFLYEVIRDIILSYKPDAILNTYPLYQSPLNALFIMQRQNIPLYTVVTDLATVHRMWFHRNVDGLIVSTKEVEKLAIINNVNPEKILIKGIPIDPRFSWETRSKQEIRSELGWDPNLTTILTVASSRVEGVLETLQVVNHFGKPLQLVAVAGKNHELYQQLSAIDWHIPIHLYEYSSEIPTLMHASDAIISKAGGLIVSEALASGLPMMLIHVIPGQETGNAEIVASNHAGSLATTPQQVLEVLSHWTLNDNQLLKKQAENARSLGKPSAALDIADILWDSALKGPSPRGKKWLENRPMLLKLLSQNHVHWDDPTHL